MRNFRRDEIRRAGGERPGATTVVQPRPADVTRDDVLGVVRVMQAQYTGRLDRLQTAVEQALSELVSSDRNPGSGHGA